MENQCTFCLLAGEIIPQGDEFPKETIEHLFFDYNHLSFLGVDLTHWLRDDLFIGMSCIEFLLYQVGEKQVTEREKKKYVLTMASHAAL